jgi:hypothetical protein
MSILACVSPKCYWGSNNAVMLEQSITLKFIIMKKMILFSSMLSFGSISKTKRSRNFSKVLFLTFITLILAATQLPAQDPIPVSENTLPESRLYPEPDCIEDPCPCEGGIIAVKLFYFGGDVVDIEVFGDNGLTNLIQTISGINDGDMFIIDGSASSIGKLYSKTYLRVTNSLGETCVLKINTKCPTNAWPGAYDDLRIVGETYGDFTVFSRTDVGNNAECTIADVDQDWHVGGNIIDPAKNTMGTRNAENVVFITDDAPRGVITAAGDYGINTMTPAARLHVQGDEIIEETLDVNGIARMNANIASTSPADGSLIVTGGAGISDDLNVGADANIGNNATVGNDLDVTNNGLIGNDLEVGNDAMIQNNLTVAGIATVTNPLGSTGPVTGALVVTGGVGIGENLNVGNTGTFGNNLRVSTAPSLSLDLNTDATGNIFHSAGANLDLNTFDNHLFINSTGSGKVAIGTIETPGSLDDGSVDIDNYRLFVRGGILADEVRVRTNWADYVFEENYQLPPLEAVKAFINKHKRLPSMPSARQVESGGLNLGEANVLQQEKIEELFLYLIDMNEEIKALKLENEMLRTRIEQLANQK